MNISEDLLSSNLLVDCYCRDLFGFCPSCLILIVAVLPVTVLEAFIFVLSSNGKNAFRAHAIVLVQYPEWPLEGKKKISAAILPVRCPVLVIIPWQQQAAPSAFPPEAKQSPAHHQNIRAATHPASTPAPPPNHLTITLPHNCAW